MTGAYLRKATEGRDGLTKYELEAGIATAREVDDMKLNLKQHYTNLTLRYWMASSSGSR